MNTKIPSKYCTNGLIAPICGLEGSQSYRPSLLSGQTTSKTLWDCPQGYWETKKTSFTRPPGGCWEKWGREIKNFSKNFSRNTINRFLERLSDMRYKSLKKGRGRCTWREISERKEGWESTGLDLWFMWYRYTLGEYHLLLVIWMGNKVCCEESRTQHTVLEQVHPEVKHTSHIKEEVSFGLYSPNLLLNNLKRSTFIVPNSLKRPSSASVQKVLFSLFRILLQRT